MKITPDRWVVLTIHSDNKEIKKVFAGWYGGYLGSDSWKLNSGNVLENEFDNRWEFTGVSGSTYICYKASYGLSAYMHSLLEQWVSKAPNDAIKIAHFYQPADITKEVG